MEVEDQPHAAVMTVRLFPSPMTQRLENEMNMRFTDLQDDVMMLRSRFLKRQRFIIDQNPLADQGRLRRHLEHFERALHEAEELIERAGREGVTWAAGEK